MRLLERNSAGEPSLTKDFVSDNIPEYAILSHRWGADTEEVTYGDLINGIGKSKAGYRKIRFCGERAKRDGYCFFWVDTCCIDKSNANAAKCYVYLSDVSTTKREASDQFSEYTWELAFRSSRWFIRGDKNTLGRQIHETTGIPLTALQGAPLSQFGVDKRLSWAEKRQTMRKEDKAYSLLGIFDVYIPLIYSEGIDNALTRLREAIEKPLKARPKTTFLGAIRPKCDRGRPGYL
ncbi:hypothetical protein BGZ57DRAFT_1015159 [Hyaloscypha finlandica]|nr:hypothetical protein BGZ57DRAFT_1015159 [Hyaloscypha finlandica]